MQPTLITGDPGRQNAFKSADLPIAYVECSLDGIILNANPNYTAMAGYAPKELIGHNIKNLWVGEDLLSSAYAEFWKHLRKNKTIAGTFRRQRKDGGVFWVEAVYSVAHGPDKKDHKIIAFYIDATRRMQSQEENLALIEALDRSFMVASYSQDGRFLEGNENFLSALGDDEQDILSKKAEYLFIQEIGARESLAQIWSTVCAGHTVTGRLQWSDADLYPVWLYTVFTPLFNTVGQVDKIIQISYDVTGVTNEENYKNDILHILSNTIDNSGSAVAITDNRNKIVYINRAYTALFGYTKAETLGKFPASIFGPEGKSFLSASRKSLSSGKPYSGEGLAYCKNSKRLWVCARVSPLLDQTGERKFTANIFTDITDLKLCETLQGKTLEGLAYDLPTKQLLELLCLEIDRVMPELNVGIMRLDNNRLTLMTEPTNQLKQLENMRLDVNATPAPAAEAAYPAMTTAEDDSLESEISEKIRTALADMDINPCIIAAIKNTAGRIIGIAFCRKNDSWGNEALHRLAESLAFLCSVIMERDENRARMRMLTYYDPLTGLPNRNLLISSSPHFFTEEEFTGHRAPIAVIYINIDQFSRINQLHSYEQGNDILRITANRLMNLKEKHDLVGRMFADQFVVISPHCNGEQAYKKAKYIQAELNRPINITDLELSLSTSIGISLCSNNDSYVDSLINDANNGLLQNKTKGPGQVNFFSPDLDSRVKINLAMETSLRKAINHERLTLYYQPQVYMNSGKIYGVEALCRWNDKKYGTVSPEQFIPLAEKSGLIEPLSVWVLREACRQLAQWRGKGLCVPSISINLSPPSFHDPTLPDRVLACLHQFGLNPSDMILELTERVLLDENPMTMTTIQRAHDLGLALSLDDFGTGYSSLSYLRSLPLSEIKLDKSFVRELHTKEVSRRLSELVMSLGQTLKLTVLAEGVENITQYRLLQQQNCHVAQGYLLSKPLPPQELEKWLVNWCPQAIADQHSLL